MRAAAGFEAAADSDDLGGESFTKHEADFYSAAFETLVFTKFGAWRLRGRGRFAGLFEWGPRPVLVPAIRIPILHPLSSTLDPLSSSSFSFLKTASTPSDGGHGRI